MHRMKPLFYACCLLIPGLLSHTLSAQQTAKDPFTIGFDVGFALGHQRDSLNTSFNAQVIQLRSSYRFRRWISFSASLGYNNINSEGEFFFSDSSPRIDRSWIWVGETHQVPIMIGSELNFRIGQGDLSITGQMGLVLHRTKVKLVSPHTAYALHFKDFIDPYNMIGVSYTYWPQKRFGIRLGFQNQGRLPGNHTSSQLRENVQLLYPELTSIHSGRIRPAGTILKLSSFQVGLTYRI